jgi:small-conductance mechanosensitive channel
VELILEKLNVFGLSVGVLAALLVLLWFASTRLSAIYANKPDLQHYRQMILIGLALFGLVSAVLLMPIGDQMRGQLLSFLGILISATIALSSTTLVGNAMAGLMLRWLRNWHIGDYIQVGEHFGKISVMDLLHVEIQTEDRDLTTLPNLYVVTHPVRVLRSSGTILHVEVSLSYNVPRQQIEAALIGAAEQAELESPFVQISNLGDFSVLYRVSGLLTDIKKLISTRRLLRACVLDSLHDAGIEIVSPNYMNTRALDANRLIMPGPIGAAAVDDDAGHPSPDEVVFDKASKAEAVAELKREYTELSQQLIDTEKAIKEADKELQGEGTETSKERRSLTLEKKKLEAALMRLEKKISHAEEELAQPSGKS